MKEFMTPKMKTVRFAAKDILTTSETEAPSEKKTASDGSITTPPDEFEDD